MDIDIKNGMILISVGASIGRINESFLYLTDLQSVSWHINDTGRPKQTVCLS